MKRLIIQMPNTSGGRIGKRVNFFIKVRNKAREIPIYAGKKSLIKRGE